MMNALSLPIKGHCFCGAVQFQAMEQPRSVCVCHCSDCRRSTGGPAIAVAAFPEEKAKFSGEVARYVSPESGAERTFCPICGTSLAFRGDYVAGQVFVHIGILEDADLIEPTVESFADERLPWLHAEGHIERFSRSSRTQLNEVFSQTDTPSMSKDGVPELCG